MKGSDSKWLLLGALVACLFTTPASGQAARSPEGGIDVRPFLALGYAESAKQVVMLQRMQANCPQNLRRAVMFDRSLPVAWFGCWLEKDGKVEIAFEDGDFISVERGSFSWLADPGGV